MKIRKLGILALSASMIGATAMALGSNKAVSVKAEEQPELILTIQQQKFLEIFSHKMNETYDDYYTYLDTWYNDPAGDYGIPYFNEFDETKTDFSAEEIEIAKKSIYLDTMLCFQLIEVQLYNTDLTRMAIDHIMPIRDDVLYLVNSLSVKNIEPNSIEAQDLCNKANNIYQGLTDLWVDALDMSFGPDQQDAKYFVVYYWLKTFLKIQSENLEGETDITGDPLRVFELMVEKVANFTKYSQTALESVIENFVENLMDTNDVDELLGYDTSAIYNWFYDPESIILHHDDIMSAFNKALSMVFYYFKTIQYIEDFCPENFNGFSLVFANIGPSMYLLIDFLDAIKGYEEDPVNNPGVYTLDYQSALGIALDLYDSTHDLLTLFTDECEDVVYENLTIEYEDLASEFAELANIKIDTVETYDAVSENLFLVFSELIALTEKVKFYADYYLNQGFKDLEIEANMLMLSCLDTILEMHDEVMNLIDNEINAIIDSVNGKADLIYSLMEEDNCDVRKLLDEAVDLSNQLSRVVIALGEYEQILGTESVIDNLKEKEEMEYAKVDALIANLRGLQKELAIESIVSRSEYITETTDRFVEIKASESDCDVLIDSINSLLIEIDDNYQILGGDERLNQTKAKLNENLNKLNELKDSVKSANTRNIILIVVGSILGAAIFFFGGFFISKLIKKEKKTI